MEKRENTFVTDVDWSTDTCEITVMEENFKKSEVCLLLDTKRGQYYVIPSNSKKRNLESLSRTLKYLKKNYIDKVAAYSDIESLDALAGNEFNPKLNANGELERKTGALISYSREKLKKCIDEDETIKKCTYIDPVEDKEHIMRR